MQPERSGTIRSGTDFQVLEPELSAGLSQDVTSMTSGTNRTNEETSYYQSYAFSDSENQSSRGFMSLFSRAYACVTQYPYSATLRPLQKRIGDVIGRVWYTSCRSSLDAMKDRGATAVSCLFRKWEEIRDSRYISTAKMLHGAPLSTIVPAGAAVLFNAASMKHGALIGLVNYLAMNHIIQFVRYGTRDESGKSTLSERTIVIVAVLTFMFSGVMGREFAKNILHAPISNKNAAVLALSSLIGTWYRNGCLNE